MIEECPLTYETQTNDVAKELIEKVLNVYIFSWYIEKYLLFLLYQFPFLFKKSKEIIGDLFYQNLKHIEAHIPICTDLNTEIQANGNARNKFIHIQEVS